MKRNYRIISDFSEIDRKEWSAFVLGHPQGNIFQSPEMFGISNYSLKSIPIGVFCLQNDKIKGLAVALILREYRGPAGRLTSRAVLTGGPLTDGNDPEITEIILENLNKLISGLAIYLEVRNLYDVSGFHDRFLKYGYEYQPHLNILVNLALDKDVLSANLHPTRRKQIERSKRRGVTVRETEAPEKAVIDRCYTILSGVYAKAGLPLPGPEYFSKAIELLSKQKMIAVFLAEHDSEIIGFRYVLCFRRVLYDWYAGSSDKYLDKYPNDILPWEVMLWGINHDFELFDFGGAGRPDEPYGVRDFKMKFGGNLVNYGRYRVIYKRVIYTVVSTVFSFYRRMKHQR